jgi:hypothetical protein
VGAPGAYWARISAHDFSAAFDYLAPGALDSSEAQWIAGEKQSRIENASFSGRVTSRDGGQATVAVQSLITYGLGGASKEDAFNILDEGPLTIALRVCTCQPRRGLAIA